MKMMGGKYKYYLSFESSFCKDYITEKFYKTLITDLVPIARGGADYASIIPKKWYINTADYASPKDLAAYLHSLDKNPEKYASYFKDRNLYKRKVFYGVRWVNAWCDLCEKLQNPNKYKNVYHNISDWWGEKHCHNPKDVKY